jgi:hypothetical protein
MSEQNKNENNCLKDAEEWCGRYKPRENEEKEMSEKNGLEIAQEEMMKAAKKLKFETCEDNCHADDIWNAAIETALQICRNRDTFESILLFSRIKELKK